MDVAFIQDSINIGGRSKVLSEAIKAFSKLSNRVGLFTLSESDSISKFTAYYDIEQSNIDLQNYHGLISKVPGTLYRQPALNWLVGEELQAYDLIFNSNNCLRFLPDGPEYIHYIHLPTPAIPKVNERYRSSPSYRLYALPIKGINKIFNKRAQEDIFITNSRFTARQYLQVYGSPPDKVIYPPSIESVTVESFSGSGVVSLGSFHPNKRQLFQIKVAEQLPGISFTIIGSAASTDYYGQCVRYIEDNNIQNVTLQPDASSEVVKESLEERRVFFHSMKNEPFGISTVEGLNAGCIPVTHDSGGQREIVSDSRLRYTSKSECINTIKQLENREYTLDTDDIRAQLENYTTPHFRTHLQECVNHA